MIDHSRPSQGFQRYTPLDLALRERERVEKPTYSPISGQVSEGQRTLLRERLEDVISVLRQAGGIQVRPLSLTDPDTFRNKDE